MAVTDRRLRTYSMLSRLPFPRSYIGKILLLIFLGTHVPLLAILFYFLASSDLSTGTELRIIAVSILATLLGTALTLGMLRALLAPVVLASSALREYLNERRVPNLPVSYTDTAGRLMADVGYSIRHLDQVIHSLESASATDYLTGVYNRRAAELHLGEELGRIERSGEPLWLVATDVDNFKRINDEHGHEVGDACLRHFVAIAEGAIRRGDWLARWGGDEFVLVLWRVGAEDVAGVLERIRAYLASNPVHTQEGEEIPLTVSMGAAGYRHGDDVGTLFARADEAMYEAKRAGRDRVEYRIPNFT